MMKITRYVLSLPPYLSTPWGNVCSLHTEQRDEEMILFVNLVSGMRVEVPGLSKESIQSIFDAFAQFTDMEREFYKAHLKEPIRPLANNGTELIHSLMQHNPEQFDAPELPPPFVEKILMIAKALGFDNALAHLVRAEPRCNCPYCQIARAIHGDTMYTPSFKQEEEELIEEQDLTFRNWDIKQTGEKLYSVSNPLDENEHYSVFLGDPLGCTCGNKNCEHVRAVLSS